jgi:uncharacterized protein
MTDLRISPDLSLPVDAVTGTFGILATKGAGKSNAAVVMAEEMWDAGVPWVAIDPKGDWFGLRSSADGKSPGLAVPVLGGRHGDVALGSTEGAHWADVVLDNRLTCVFDVSQFTKAETTRFLLAFAQRLFRQAESEPLHLFMEEAHEYLPQVVKGDQAELVGAMQRIVKQGRFKGLGVTLISQRSSSLNKDVLELIDTLIVLRTIGPRSRKSIADWVHDQDVDPTLMASLPSLGDGEAWIWSPGELRLFERIRFRRRRTFDSGATPKVGESRRPPATLADVDLATIKEAMAESIERAKADDPKELRRQIADLRKQLAARPVTETVEVPFPVIDDSVIQRLEAIFEPVSDLSAALRDALLAAGDLRGGRFEPRLPSAGEAKHGRKDVSGARAAGGGARPVERPGPPQRVDPAQRREPRRPSVPRPETTEGVADSLSKVASSMLAALAEAPDGLTRRQLGARSGYPSKKSTFRGGVAELRKAGYLDGTADLFTLTDAGRAAAPAAERPTGEELWQFWMAKLGEGPRVFLEVLREAWPRDIPRDELAEATGYDSAKSTWRGILATLRSYDLIVGSDPIGLAPDFAEAIHG